MDSQFLVKGVDYVAVRALDLSVAACHKAPFGRNLDLRKIWRLHMLLLMLSSGVRLQLGGLER